MKELLQTLTALGATLLLAVASINARPAIAWTCIIVFLVLALLVILAIHGQELADFSLRLFPKKEEKKAEGAAPKKG